MVFGRIRVPRSRWSLVLGVCFSGAVLLLLPGRGGAAASTAPCPAGSPSGGRTFVDCAFTGGLQTFTVPANVDSVTFNVYGAQGARPSQSTLAGEGGVEHGTVSVTPGETLTILVGGEGQGGAGGFGGGADGGAGSIAGGGGGGGGSFIYHGDGNLIVAAGGGGGSGIGASNSCLTNGGGGGGDAGSSGCGGAPSSADAGGGTQSQGGSAGNGADDGGAAGRGPASWSSGAPVPGAGGAGGAADYGGGGGGGGYYGGGGSGGVGSGGGGSGYLGPGVTDQRFFSGSSPGNGHVSINYLTPTPPEINSAPVGQFSAGEAGSFEITATGVPTPTLSQGGGPLPAGLTFTDQGNGIATITGTPAAGTEGVYSITVTASNGVGYDFGETVTLYVRQPCPQGAPAAGGRWVVTCSYDGQIETFTVPAGVTSVSLDVKGAQGGASSSGDAGALGGEATATFPVSYSGEVLTVIAGGRGTDGVASPSPSGGPGGYGGGGEGGSGSGGSGGGGGGGSYVFNRAGDLLAVGGGGAGAVVGGCNGGSGGGTNGADDGCGTGGRGGRSQEGGRGTIGGTGVSSGSGPASISDDIPTFGQGGNGGTFDVGGGGGGGGYYGGGGGAGGTPGPPPHAAGGGGGGSGFVAGSGVDTTQTSGVSSGDGVITITYTPAPPTAMITSPVSGRTFRQGQVVATSFRCIDSSSGPGVSSCKDSRGVSAPHGHLNTSTLGRHTYQVTAMSEDGQHATQTITYTVKPRPPVCTVRQPGGAVLLPAKGKQPTGRQGQIEVKVTCNQHVAMRVAGSLRSVLGNQTRTFSLARVSVPAAAGRASSAVLKLPSGALTQLRKGARQSVSLTLTGTNANGRWSGRATIARLHGVVG